MYVLFLKDTYVENSGYIAKKGDIEYVENSLNYKAFFLEKEGCSVMYFRDAGSDSYLLCSDKVILEYIRDTGKYDLIHKHDANKENPGNGQIPVFDSPEWLSAGSAQDTRYAIHLYNQLIEAHKLDIDDKHDINVLAPMLNNRAIRYEELGEYEKALDDFSNALNLIPFGDGARKFIQKNIDICHALKDGRLLKREKAVFSGPYT